MLQATRSTTYMLCRLMGANIELWEYTYYEDGSLHLEEVFRKSNVSLNGKSTIGQKAAETKANANYRFDDHYKKGNDNVKELLNELRDSTLDIDPAVEEAPKKLYIAYKTSQNFLCAEVHKSKLLLYLKIKPEMLKTMPANGRDVTNIGHFGTGNFELNISNKAQLDEAKELIKLSYEGIGGS